MSVKRLLSSVFMTIIGKLSEIYFLRAPLLTAIGLLAFCGLTWSGSTRSLLGGIFDVGDSPLAMFFVSLTAFLAAWVVMATWRLVRLYGPIRNPDLEQPLSATTFGGENAGSLILYYGLVLLVALPPILLTLSISEGTFWQWIAAVVGFVASSLCIGFVVWVQLRFTRQTVAEAESPDLFLPTQLFFKETYDAARADNRSEQRAVANTNIFRNWPEEMFRGYFEYGSDDTVDHIRPGHVAAFVLFVLTFAGYLLLGIGKYLNLRFGIGNYLRLGDTLFVPTLCYVLLLAMLLCWVFYGLAFFLDRYRIPVLIPVAAWLAITSVVPWSDYRYPVETIDASSEELAQSGGGSTLADEDSGDDSLIVVAANGGGIQAAAWTAKVLTGLEKECRDQCDKEFDENVSLISSVSGGSVGTMYFVNEYKDGQIDPNAKLNSIVNRSEGSSIDEISWGVLYPDLVRSVLSKPIPFGWDRGRALEEAWLRQDTSWESRAGIEKGLSAWREDAVRGDRPAVIFNTTITESGQRLPLATTDLPDGSPGRVEYDGLFKAGVPIDIQVVTAARLSASFPYVSPAARADIDGPSSHIVDGGYYDNYGVTSLVEWLNAKLPSDQNINKVLIIEIRGAPWSLDNTNEDPKACPEETDEPRKSKAGWYYQYLAPPLTVLGVRDKAQRGHNEVELGLLTDRWDEQDEENEKDKQGADEPHRVEITRAIFEYDCTDTPLSWHLSADDKRYINKNWQEELTPGSEDRGKGWEKVRAFLNEDKSAE